MTRRIFEIAAFCAALLIAALAIHAWLSSRDEQQRLQSTLAAQKQILDAADTREQTRHANASAIVPDLPQYLPLPHPITLAPPATGTNAQQGIALPTNPETARQPSPPAPQPAMPCQSDGNCVAQIPAPDLKPLYDFTQNCRECQVRLTAAHIAATR